MKISSWLAGVSCVGLSCAAIASETTTFEYDAQGRLIQSTRAGGPADGTTKVTSFDRAGNRTNQTVTGVPAPPSFSINNVSVTEGGTATFTVTKAGTASASHSVSWATANNTATAGSDYTAGSGTVTFTSAQTTRTFTVPTTNDSVYETTENFRVNLSGATGGATISDSQGTGTINDNDAAPSFSINNVSVTEGGTTTFTVTKAGTASASHSVSWATANNTAIAGSDYTAGSGTLTFTSAQTTRTFTVPTTNDSTDENNETFYANLSNATGGATISDSQGVGTIIDNDDPPPNNPPVANTDTQTMWVCAGLTVNVTGNDTDPDNDYPLTVISVSAPSQLSASVSGTTSILVVAGTTSGIFPITYTIQDSRGATANGTLNVTVNPGPCF